ncbi:MAG: methionine--tRNA ligase [archaeon]|jgi:methionyl-tRNA synthetase
MKTRIITAALPFVNNVPHLGNIVGSHLPADIFARYSRMKGHKVIFVGGTDEHGTATEFAAQQKGVTPKEICDYYYDIHKDLYSSFLISYDNFSRTSREIHHKLVQEFFLDLYNNKCITEKIIKIPYCNSCKRGLADRYITGTCPKCNYDKASGDQCESCGTVLDPIDLITPHCSVCKTKDISFRDTKHLFLDLRNLSKDIEKWIDENPHLRSQVKALAKGWITQGIQERCITRDLTWGIKIPIPGYEDKVFYVWFDNVIGYVSGTAELLGEAEAKKLWQDKTTETYYFIGKDNIPFHTIFWPGQIIGQGKLVLPYNVVGLQYMNFGKQKFSKSKGIGIFADKAIESNIPIEYWRFYLTYIMPETKDSEFMVDDFFDRVNKELISNYGNFVNRVLNFIYTKQDGKVQEIKVRDEKIEKEILEAVAKIDKYYDDCEFRFALYELLKLSDLGNRYLNEKEPWKSGDTTSLSYCLEIIRLLSIYFSPILPESSKKINSFLNTTNTKLEINTKAKIINKPEILFRKLEDLEKEQFN